jgi:hypothetical protein
MHNEVLRGAKVDQDRPALRGHDDIGGLEVAQDDWRLLVMQVGEHVTQLEPVPQDLTVGQSPEPAQARRQGLALDVIHHQETCVAMPEVIEHARDVRMSERSQQARLAEEACADGIAFSARDARSGAQLLQGDRDAQPHVQRLVDAARGAAPDYPEQEIAAVEQGSFQLVAWVHVSASGHLTRGRLRARGC